MWESRAVPGAEGSLWTGQHPTGIVGQNRLESAGGARAGRASPPASVGQAPLPRPPRPAAFSPSGFTFQFYLDLPVTLPRAAVTVETESRGYRVMARTHPPLGAHCVTAASGRTPSAEATPQSS